MKLTTFPERYLNAVEARPKPDRTGAVRCISTHSFHNVAFTDWGVEGNREHVLCVHGLTRNGRDFDTLASRLCQNARVICPDLAGRGQSDWLSDPSHYHILQYNMDMTVLTAAVGFDRFDWIGTSLGGLMGMALAGIERTPIRRLILNDVGPTIPTAALRRIGSYAGSEKTYATLEEVEINLRATLSPFGPMTDDDWARMAVHSAHPEGDGYRMHHDPGIIRNFNRYALFTHFNLWRYWERIECPVLILRGTESDFLTDSLLARMLSRLPTATVVEFPGIGHTPTLNAPEQIDPIANWLEKTRSEVE